MESEFGSINALQSSGFAVENGINKPQTQSIGTALLNALDWINDFTAQNVFYLYKKRVNELKLVKYIQFSYKKLLNIKSKSIRYRKYFIFLLRRLKYRKKKKTIFKK